MQRAPVFNSAGIHQRIQRLLLSSSPDFMQWHEHIEKINSKEGLADFVELLRQDLQAHPEEWENPTLDRFLDAMEAWIRSLDNYYINTKQPVPHSPSWRTFADILYASKIYE